MIHRTISAIMYELVAIIYFYIKTGREGHGDEDNGYAQIKKLVLTIVHTAFRFNGNSPFNNI